MWLTLVFTSTDITAVQSMYICAYTQRCALLSPHTVLSAPFQPRREQALIYIYENMIQSVQAALKSIVNIKFITSDFALKSKDKNQRTRDYIGSIVSYLPQFFIKLHVFMIISFTALFPLSQLVYCHETTV